MKKNKKQNVKQKRIIITSTVLGAIILATITAFAYVTLATDIFSSNVTSSDVDYSFVYDLKDSEEKTVTLSQNEKQVLDFIINNPYDYPIQYGIAYKETFNNGGSSVIGKLEGSRNDLTGIIPAKSSKMVTIFIASSACTHTYKITAVTGYEHGGNLITPSGMSMLTQTYDYDYKFSGRSPACAS